MAKGATREQVIDRAMQRLYGNAGPEEEVDPRVIRAILADVFDAGWSRHVS
jgi:hypothetical protein